jgi:DNA-binding transcriptional MerR regulator
MAGWTARELARLTGVPVPTVTFWVNSGLVDAEHRGRGRGGHSIGLIGLVELLAVVELRQVGFSLQAIRRAVENLRELSGQHRPLARLTLVVVGRDIVWKDSNEISDMTISALHRPGQRLMVLPIGEKQVELLRQLQVNDDLHSGAIGTVIPLEVSING